MATRAEVFRRATEQIQLVDFTVTAESGSTYKDPSGKRLRLGSDEVAVRITAPTKDAIALFWQHVKS